MSDIDDIEAKLKSLLRGKHSSLHLDFNDHHADYIEAKDLGKQFLERTHTSWVSPEERDRAMATDSVWTLHWYPDTQVGFYSVSASSLKAVLEAALDGGDHADHD